MRSDQDHMSIDELKKKIAALPKGSVSKKDINGKTYYYHRWQEDKRRHEKYVPFDEVDELKRKIESRKQLEAELEKLGRVSGSMGQENTTDRQEHAFETHVRIGKELRTYAFSVRNYKKREGYKRLKEYVYGDSFDKVFVLYGLRRTGKTTLIRQILWDMSDEDIEKAAFIQITARDDLARVNRDLRYLEKEGFRYVFMDEVTLMEDFIEGAALFSDIFAACGMKIVLSGTDSLGFLFTEDEQLYDRCEMLHTTFIPYREFETVLGIKGIDEYIRYGGTMSLGGMHYNETSTFASKERADEYVDTAIAHNIQHSLRCYQGGGHFRALQRLYEKDELTSAINRVVEDMNHRFTMEVLTRDFRSSDLAISARNLRRDRSEPTDILDRIDVDTVTSRLMQLLEIRNRNEQSLEPDDECAWQIREYLHLLDLIEYIDVASLPEVNQRGSRTVIAQPGLRYAQADALIKSLMEDQLFSELSLTERNAVTERIRSEIRGRMMEDIVLLETKLAYKEKDIFVLQFPVGEFDMVVADPQKGVCSIYEIKHSREAVPEQYRHLKDEEKCAAVEHRYGSIASRAVIYRGEDQKVDDITYINVEKYLKGLTIV